MTTSNHFAEIGKTLHRYQQEGFLCDTVLIVEGNEYKAHSVVLAAASTFFKSVYIENSKCNVYYIQMPGFDCDTIEVALCYIYTGKLLLPAIYKQAGQLTKLLTSLQQLGFDLKTFNGCQMTFKGKDTPTIPVKKTKKVTQYKRSDHNYMANRGRKGNRDVMLSAHNGVVLQIEKTNDTSRPTFQMQLQTESDQDTCLDLKPDFDTLSDQLTTDIPIATKKGRQKLSEWEKNEHSDQEEDNDRILQSLGDNDESLLLECSDANLSESTLSSKGARSAKTKLKQTDAQGEAKKKGSRKRHLCAKCGKSFTSAALAAHMVVHSGMKPYPCQHCDKVFSYKKNLYRHSLLHRGSKPYLCEVCGTGFTQKANLDSHIRSGQHGGQPYERSCPRRPRATDEPGHYRCPLCEHEFSTSVSLKLHINRIHQSLLMSHAENMLDSADQLPSKLCDCCGRYFSSDASLKAHRWRTHRNKVIQCPVCKKGFSCRALLISHSVVHTGEKPFPCPKCGKGFRFKGAMRIHYRIHTGERPYKCEFCSRRFHQTSHLKRHRRTHTGEKPYGCLLCKKTYKNRLDLRLHCLRVHQVNIKHEPGTTIGIDLIKHESICDETQALQSQTLNDSVVQPFIVELQESTD